MTDKPTGIFVRLPMSDTEKMALTSGVKMGGDIEAGIAAIGTPVTGGELAVFDIVDAAYGNSDTKYVRQSDALAKLAEKDARIAQLDKVRAEIARQMVDACAEVIRLQTALLAISENKTSDCPRSREDSGYMEQLGWAVEWCRRTARNALKGPEV